jgi:hypothetical protein
MSHLPKSITAKDAAGNVLCLTLHWHVDRWHHEILWSPPGQSPMARWSSREGTADDDWPPSPPMQEISFGSVDRRQGGIALLLGRAGSSHWSAALELSDDPLQLVVDVACRISQSPQAIGSGYRLVCGPEMEATVAPFELTLRAGACLRASASTGNLNVCRGQETEVAFTPNLTAPPATIRWTYQFRVAV